jgi:hypothetical protein
MHVKLMNDENTADRPLRAPKRYPNALQILAAAGVIIMLSMFV